MSQHEPDDPRPPAPSGTLGQEVRDGAREVGRELGTMMLRLIAGVLLTIVGVALLVGSLFTGSDLMRYAGIAVMFVGILTVAVAWNSHGVPWF